MMTNRTSFKLALYRLSIIALICVSFGYSQLNDEFKLTSSGAEPLVVETEGLSAEDLYNKSKLYISKRYKNPDHVIKADTPNKLLRFRGYEHFSTGTWSGGEFSYLCDLEFKDGRYKISYSNFSSTGSPGYTLSSLYNSKGELRKYDFHKQVHKNFEDAMNNNHRKLKEFILSADEGW